MLPPFGNPYELTEIEERLGLAADDVSLLFARACILDTLGRNNEARDAYIEVIKRDRARTWARWGTWGRSFIMRAIAAWRG